MNKKAYRCLTWKRGRQDTKDYYRTDKRAWIYNWGSAAIVAIVTPIVSYCLGQITMVSQLALSILAGLIGGAIVFIIWYCTVSVHNFLDASRKIYNEKVIELEKYDWGNTVDFSFSSEHILGLDVWVLKIKNNKHITLDEVSVFYIRSRYGQDNTMLGTSSRIGFIDKKDEIIVYQKEKIDPEKELSFVITAKETGDSVWYLRTEIARYPVIFLGLDFSIDFRIDAKTLANIKLPTKIMRLSIDIDGTVKKRENYERERDGTK